MAMSHMQTIDLRDVTGQAGDYLTDVVRQYVVGCKMNWAGCLSGCPMQLLSHTNNKPLITTISLASLQPR